MNPISEDGLANEVDIPPTSPHIVLMIRILFQKRFGFRREARADGVA